MHFFCRFWRAVGSYKLTKSSLMRISYSQRLRNLKQSFSAVRTNRQINLTCSLVIWPDLSPEFHLVLSISCSIFEMVFTCIYELLMGACVMCIECVSWLGAKDMVWACSWVLTYRCKLQLFSPALNVPVLFQTQGLYSFCMLFAVWKILFWF